MVEKTLDWGSENLAPGLNPGTYQLDTLLGRPQFSPLHNKKAQLDVSYRFQL